MEANIYYSPEKFGLEEVAEVDYSSGSYEFDLRVVWKDKNNAFWTASDSGCSCPTPFEDMTIEELERLDIAALESEVKEATIGKYKELTVAEGADFLAKIREAVWLANGGVQGNAPVDAP